MNFETEDTRKIVIEIVADIDDDEKPTDKEGIVKRPETKPLEHVLLNQAFNQAKNLLSQSINTSLARYYNMKEDYMYENNINIAKQVIGKTSSFFTTVGGGVALGGLAGGLIAGAGWLGSEMINLNNRWNSVYAEINATNYNKAFTKERMGLVDGGKGTEN